jgi:hypothetical protein
MKCSLRQTANMRRLGTVVVAAMPLGFAGGNVARATVFNFMTPNATNVQEFGNPEGGTQGGGENVIRVGLSQIGEDPPNNIFRGVFDFDLTGLSIPAGEQINDVKLRLYYRADEDSPGGEDGVIGPIELRTIGEFSEQTVRFTDVPTNGTLLSSQSFTPQPSSGNDLLDPNKVVFFNSTPNFISAVNAAGPGGHVRFVAFAPGEEALKGTAEEETFARFLSDDSQDPFGVPILMVDIGPPGGVAGDFNNDAVVNATDIDLLCDRINANTGPTSPFDVNNDGSVNSADVNFEVTSILHTKFGDTDTDGDVDLNDLGNLASGFGQPGEKRWSKGNFDCDQDVDLPDLGTLATNFGAGRAAAMAAFEALVPEPSALSLLGLAALGLSRRSRRSHV